MIFDRDAHALAILELMDVPFTVTWVAMDLLPEYNENVIDLNYRGPPDYYKLELYAFENKPSRDGESMDYNPLLLWDTKSKYKRLYSTKLKQRSIAIRHIKNNTKALWKLDDFLELYA